ncbi:MAG: hypothetical protein IKL10_09930 [Clostridia bacterium]|nr:hypothetical protein [Clostridia bacterium]
MIIIDDVIKKIEDRSKINKYDCGESNQLYVCFDFSQDEFNNIVSDIRSCGYSEAQSCNNDNLISFTFEKDRQTIVFYYDKASHELRFITDNYSKRLNTTFNTAGKCPVKLWQFEVDHSLIDCGMCYIVQCSDYSFFIVDSAHTYSVNDDKRIYELLRHETPDNMKVIVSGWFLTHGHVDHIAKFLDILQYNDDIVIKGLYYNFVPTDHFSSDSWMASDKNHTEIFNKIVAKRTDIPVYKLHSGQYFYIDCLRFDVLCTHEDVYPGDLENYNDSSTVLMMTVGDDKVCFPGDAGGAESTILERRFPNFLKCDIMQVAHHGHFGTSVEFYKLANADVALFATTQIKFDEEYPHYEANRVACDIAKHVFIASNGTVQFNFPLKNSVINLYPDETIESFDGVYNLWGYSYSDEFKNALIEQFKFSDKYREINY